MWSIWCWKNNDVQNMARMDRISLPAGQSPVDVRSNIRRRYNQPDGKTRFYGLRVVEQFNRHP